MKRNNHMIVLIIQNNQQNCKESVTEIHCYNYF
jgi:hypothetical protein